MFEWDERKRLINIEKHGLDFEDAVFVFDGRPVLEAMTTHPEGRLLTVALWEERFITVVWTWRGECRRIISMRVARHEERAAYRELFG